jgi:hypothetical protein
MVLASAPLLWLASKRVKEREREEKKKLREEDGKRDGSGMDRFLCEFECHGYE